jgi:hypothetical protein
MTSKQHKCTDAQSGRDNRQPVFGLVKRLECSAATRLQSRCKPSKKLTGDSVSAGRQSVQPAVRTICIKNHPDHLSFFIC